jgi:phage shock protein A
MGLGRRLAALFGAKANAALDRAEDPRETLDYSYERQLELLAQVRRGVADVATNRRRLELQVAELRGSADKLEAQARTALTAGREDLAREALTRRSGLQEQVRELDAQREQLQQEENRLVTSMQRLQAKVESFRTRKETMKASYSAAEAQARIGEAYTGLSEEMGDVGIAMQRAQDKTERMKARAGAIDDLIASGALTDVTATGPGDDIARQLDALSAGSAVDSELTRLKGELAGGSPAAVEAGGRA